MCLICRMASIVRVPDPDRDPACKKHRAWMKEFKAREIPADELVLEHARRVYDEFNRSYDVNDAKAGEVLKASGLMVTIFVAAIGALKLDVGWFVFSALGFFLLSIVLALRARIPLVRSGEPSARDVLDQGSHLEPKVMRTWLAASSHLMAEELRVAVHWKAERVREATWCLFVALVFVMAAVLGYCPS